MVNVLSNFVGFISKLSRAAFVLASWMVVLLVLLVVEQVISRYFFNSSSIGLQELQWHLFGFIITLSIAHTLDVNGHVRVDILSSRIGKKIGLIIHAIGFLLLVLLCLALAYFGWQDIVQARSFTASAPIDFYTAQLFSKDSSLYYLFAQLESWLRATVLVGEGSSDAGGLEARWIIKSAFPLGMILLALQSFCLFIRCLIPSLRKDEEYRWL